MKGIIYLTLASQKYKFIIYTLTIFFLLLLWAVISKFPLISLNSSIATNKLGRTCSTSWQSEHVGSRRFQGCLAEMPLKLHKLGIINLARAIIEELIRTICSWCILSFLIFYSLSFLLYDACVLIYILYFFFFFWMKVEKIYYNS